MSPQEVVDSVGIPATLSHHNTVGFHGTSEAHAEEICRDGFSTGRCKNGLFGRGPYFYEDNAPHPGIAAAFDYATERKQIEQPVALSADLVLARAFDLVNEEENRNLFQKLQKKLVDMAISAEPDMPLDERKIGSATITFIGRFCPEADGMQGVRAEFRLKMLDGPQQGLCILDCRCIQNVRQH